MKVWKQTICMILAVGLLMCGPTYHLRSASKAGSVDLQVAILSVKAFMGVAEDNSAFQEKVKIVISALRTVAGIETGISEDKAPDAGIANLFSDSPFLMSSRIFSFYVDYSISENRKFIPFVSFSDSPETPPPRQKQSTPIC